MEQRAKQWGCQIEIDQAVSFPSISVRDLFRRLSAADSAFALETVQPEVFPGNGTTEEQIDQQYSYTFLFSTDLGRDEIKAYLAKILKGAKGISKIRLGQAEQKIAIQRPSEPTAANNAQVTGEVASARKAHSSMRVDLVKIEDLVNLIGELIINKNQVDALSQSILGVKGDNVTEAKQQIADFQIAKHQLNYVTGKLRDLALGIRMISIGTTLRKFPAAVRDLARKQGKEISVVIEGGETELDKAILEEISDPLLHMIRNAVDHGIEMPEDRRRKGKKTEGTVLIKAEHEGDRISILVEDDGAGLNSEKILRKALEKGIVSARQAGNLGAKEVFQLIFSPGFSTADTVSELSGRGVGMDVVRSNIMRLNGIVDVESGSGAGTRITMKLPLTLSILEGLLLEDLGQTYAIPLIAIEKAYRIDASRLKRVGRYWLIEKDNITLPVFRIAELFGRTSTVQQSAYYLIEASAADGRFGLMVQKIVGRQEVVLKPLGEYLGKVTGVSGSTILGNGQVALILDTKTIADSVSQIIREESVTASVAEPVAKGA